MSQTQGSKIASCIRPPDGHRWSKEYLAWANAKAAIAQCAAKLDDRAVAKAMTAVSAKYLPLETAPEKYEPIER